MGDRVEVFFPVGPLWVYSLLFFGLPAAALTLGIVSVSFLGWTSTAALGAGGGTAFVSALALSLLIYRRMARRNEELPSIARILGKETERLQLS